MSNHSLSSIMGLTSNPLTGKVICLRVCANCERDGNQSTFVQSYAHVLGCGISHGICQTHYQSQLASLLGERSDPEPTPKPESDWDRLRATYSDAERDIYA